MAGIDAWAPYEPGGGRPWNLALAAHLLGRAGFGAGWSQLQQALKDGPRRTVDRLLNPPAGLDSFESRLTALGASVAISDDAGSDEPAQLWLYRMLQTPYPLLEKMTLFWHNYFAVAGARVGKTALMERHLRLLRRHALGRFDALAGDICRDPATLTATGAGANRKARPSEEFAKTLLERYTLGPGSFRASDVRETARAFTGSFVLRGEFRYLAYEHDAGAQSGDDVVKALLAQPATPRWVVRRLYNWLISETGEPDDALLAPLAESFAKDYDIRKLAGAMLRSNLFFSPAAYRQRVKSPLEFALGIALAFEAPVPTVQLHGQLATLGQKLLEPPSREGWPGGRRWLNRFTLVGRSNLAAALLATMNPQAIAEKYGRGADATSFFAELLVQSGEARQPAHAVVTSPEFQLA